MADDTEDPPWRTRAVVELIHDMRARRDYSNLPILADALDEAGYDVPGIAAVFRAGCTDSILLTGVERSLCLILGGEYEASVRWIEEFAHHLERVDSETYGRGFRTDYSELVDAGRACLAAVARGTPTWNADGATIHLSFETSDAGVEPGDPRLEEFWRHLAVVTATEYTPDVDKKRYLFSCSC